MNKINVETSQEKPEHIIKTSESNVISKTFNKYDFLNPIGRFIEKNGLAVFLVIFYTVSLHPGERRERGKWLEEITAIRMLVDPATRPLSRQQAQDVLEISLNAYVQELKNTLNYESVTMPGFRQPYAYRPVPIEKTTAPSKLKVEWFFGQRFEFKTSIESDSLENIENIINDFEELKNKNNLSFIKTLKNQLKQSSNSYQSNVYLLGRLRYNNESLETIWRNAIRELNEKEKTEFEKTESYLIKYEIENFLRFIEQHPSYVEFKKSNSNKIENIKAKTENTITTDEIIEKRRAFLKNNFEKQLNQSE